MSIRRRYNPRTAEPKLQARWQQLGVYNYSGKASGPDYIIDTPPPTVSGHLHLGHIYSYSHADFFARFWRMKGQNVLYPMGFDDNGLPTERLVERQLGIRAADISRSDFINKCLQVSEEAEKQYEEIWRRMALSIDWRYTYRTIDDETRRLSQLSFIDLYKNDLVYRQKAPTVWCPERQTAIAQAELDDFERSSEFVVVNFKLGDGNLLPIATTRPELLPACVAIFIHPEDARYQKLIGHQTTVPLFDHDVSIVADEDVDPNKGTGAVMCYTFGDTTDVSWWYKHNLKLIEAVSRDGRMTANTGSLGGLSVSQARKQIKEELASHGLITDRLPSPQSVRVHERCGTTVEYIVTSQWFIRLLDFKKQFLIVGDRISWYPEYMKTLYMRWVENLNWDWCILRQRYYGVPFPVWYCDKCGLVIIAKADRRYKSAEKLSLGTEISLIGLATSDSGISKQFTPCHIRYQQYNQGMASDNQGYARFRSIGTGKIRLCRCRPTNDRHLQ